MTAQLHSAFGSNKKGTVCSKGIYYPFWKATWQQPVDLFTYNTLFKLLFLGFHPIVIKALAQRPVVVLGPCNSALIRKQRIPLPMRGPKTNGGLTLHHSAPSLPLAHVGIYQLQYKISCSHGHLLLV